jgi:hypothetical protein
VWIEISTFLHYLPLYQDSLHLQGANCKKVQ